MRDNLEVEKNRGERAMAQDEGRNPALRVSDAERDAVVTELGQHFQDGRLDQGEFDQRVGSALAARTRSDLDALVIDLPRPFAGGPPTVPGARSPWPRALAVVPLVAIAAFIAAAAHAGWDHRWSGGWPFAPFGFLWLIVPILIIRARTAGGRRQWR
jgi:hypothetical protein